MDKRKTKSHAAQSRTASAGGHGGNPPSGGSRPGSSAREAPRGGGTKAAARSDRAANSARGSGPATRARPRGRTRTRDTDGAAANRDRGGESSSWTAAPGKMLDVVKQHPVPAALVGAGLAWLLLETRPARDVERRMLEQARRAAGSVGGRFSDLAGTAREAFTEAAETSRDRVGAAGESLADYARTGASTVGDTLRGGATAVGQTAKAGYQRGRDAVSDAWDQHPLASGVALLAAGLAAGLMLPSTRREGSLMGGAAGDLTRRVRDMGAELLERGQEVMSSTADAVTRAARRATGPGSSSSRTSSSPRSRR